MERFDEFTLGGKSFMYVNVSGLRGNDNFMELIKLIESSVVKYPERSLFVITNIENIRFDSDTKVIYAEHLERYKSYFKHIFFIGLDGAKKAMLNEIFRKTGQKTVSFAFSKEQAIERMLELD